MSEKFTPVFLKDKTTPAMELQLLQQKYRGMSDLLEKVATFPAKVSYPHVLVPQCKVALRYMRIVHTNEFKLLPESHLDKPFEEQQKALESVDFVSYVEAGQQLKDRQHSLVKKIMDLQRKHGLPLSKFDEKKTNASVSTARTAPPAAKSAESESSEPNSVRNNSVALPTTKHAVPKPQVFEIREYISESGQASNEMVDITQQLEMMEKMAAEQTSSDGVGFNDDDDFVRELAKIRSATDATVSSTELGDLDDIFARLQEKPHPAATAPVASSANASAGKTTSKAGGWKAGFLSDSATKKPASASANMSAETQPSQPQPAKKGLQFSTFNEVRTINAQSTVSHAAPSEALAAPVTARPAAAVKTAVLEREPPAVKPFSGAIAERQAAPPKPVQMSVMEKTPPAPRPFGVSILEKQPAAPKPMVLGNTRRNV